MHLRFFIIAAVAGAIVLGLGWLDLSAELAPLRVGFRPWKDKRLRTEIPPVQAVDSTRQRPTPWSPLDDTGTSRRCNQDNTQQNQNETPCIADPVNPDIVLVGANDSRNQGNWNAGFYRTTDAGATWADAIVARGVPSGNCQAGDPALAIDRTGRMYATYIAFYCQTAVSGIYTHTSTDHGQTWSAPVLAVNGNSAGVDKELTCCDVSPESPYLNNHYVVWMSQIAGNRGIGFTRSTNGGTTYSTPLHITDANSDVQGPCPATGPEGQVYVAWRTYWPNQIKFDRSLDGGQTWGTDILISNFNDNTGGTNCGGFRTPNLPALACDISQSAYRGNLYACWAGTVGSDPEIYFSQSTNGGMNWSAAVRINDDNSGRWQWFPWIAVHPRTGDVGIAWLDRREDSQNCRYRVWGTISTDGGATWAPNFRISDSLANPTNSGFIGDYTGTTFCNLGFFSSWPDPRNDICDTYATWWNNGFDLVLLTPDSGAVLDPGQSTAITWQYRYAPDSLLLELNRGYPDSTWEEIGWVASADCTYTWTVTGPNTEHARLRLSGGSAYPTLVDTTDADFAIGMSAPTRVTCYRIGPDVRLRWRATGAPYYHIYSATVPDGPFNTLEGSVAENVFLDLGAAEEPLKFYTVVASDQP